MDHLYSVEIVNEQLALTGATINGETIDIEAKEISIEDVINKIRTRSNYIEAGIGVGISFFGGGIGPQALLGTGKEIRDSDLVAFISGITGQDVKITAEKLSASLDAITSQGTLREFIKEKKTTQRPRNNVHHQAWGGSASLCIGVDGKINPTFMPYFEEDGRRVSATISPDLFKGLNMIGNFLSSDYANNKQGVNDKIFKKSEELIGTKYKDNPEVQKQASGDARKLTEGDDKIRNTYYKLELKAKDTLGIKEESIFGRIGNFLGKLFIKEGDEDLEPFKSLTPEEQLELAKLMGGIYGMSNMISMQDSPSEIRKKIEVLNSQLNAMGAQYAGLAWSKS